MALNWNKSIGTKILKLKFKILVKMLNFKQNKIRKLVLKKPNNIQKAQIDDSSLIPIIIINFNQLFYLKKLIDFLIDKQSKNIIIIDNASNYKPLLDYYDLISKIPNITIEYQSENLGHLVFWKNRELYNKYSKGFFVITDADIVPNDKLENDYLAKMINILLKNKNKTKIGFALDIYDLPDYYPLKQKVIQWESKFWDKEIEKDIFNADIDTTFALYWPFTDRITSQLYGSFFSAIRLGGDFTSQHGGWFLDYKNLTEEQLFYLKTASGSNSWKFDDNGKLIGDFIDDY